ncbi:uncharacterized protein LOC134077875 [Sardina pilchardus]|uniref:uncharacterized protein LOC134077875 n=1 Tax=Sardina pilchardus TaxID=27697 RepID=UPI002E1299E8
MQMRSVTTLLVLLFSMCGAQTQSTQTEVQTESQSTGAAAAAVTTTLDVSAELRELRDMVVELRVLLTVTQNELQNTKAEIKDLKMENAAQKTELAVLKERLVVSETKVEALDKVNSAQDTELAVLKTRLAASETEVVNLRKETAAHETKLAATKTEVENRKMENTAQEAELTAVKTRLATTETDVVNLEKKVTDQPKVAFSAGLTDSGYIESGNTQLNLVFTEIITNAGQAYSRTTGFFTAPVRGVYYFRFTVLDVLTSRQMMIKMFKNGQQIMFISEYDTDGQHTFLSSGVTLQLEVGDAVNLRLPAHHRLYGNHNNYSIFSGFLLFVL